MANYSKQREEILNVLQDSKTHPSAQQVYRQVKANGSTASKSTVYRNLKLLSEEGVIQKVMTEDEFCHYDYSLHPHGHAVCRCCGKIMDFDAPMLDEIKKMACEKLGGSFDEVALTVNGICKECQEHLNQDE